MPNLFIDACASTYKDMCSYSQMPLLYAHAHWLDWVGLGWVGLDWAGLYWVGAMPHHPFLWCDASPLQEAGAACIHHTMHTFECILLTLVFLLLLHSECVYSLHQRVPVFTLVFLLLSHRECVYSSHDTIICYTVLLLNMLCCISPTILCSISSTLPSLPSLPLSLPLKPRYGLIAIVGALVFC